jgi:hypothetical protein
MTGFLAPLDCCPKNISILAVIVSELELCNIERHIFAAHFVEGADRAALEDRPEAFNGLGMDCADDILTSRMVNSCVWVIPVEALVSGPLISAKQADFVGNGFADKRVKRGSLDVRDNTSDHVSLALSKSMKLSSAAWPKTGIWDKRGGGGVPAASDLQ